MGLFDKKKTSSGGVLPWLQSADNAYNLAFQTKSIKPLQGYVDETLAIALVDKIRAGEKAYAGLDRYKHVSWSRLGSDDTTTTFIKEVHYDHVKFSQGVVAPVGDDHKERWVVQTQPTYCVLDIRRIAK